MSNVFFPYSKAPLRTIKEIQFGLFAPEEIKRLSVVHVEYPEALVCATSSIPEYRFRELDGNTDTAIVG